MITINVEKDLNIMTLFMPRGFIYLINRISEKNQESIILFYFPFIAKKSMPLK